MPFEEPIVRGIDPSTLRAAVRKRTGSISFRTVLRDLAVVLAWFVAATLVFRATGWPVAWYYLIVFGGVVAYTLLFDPWDGEGESTRPAR